MRLARLHQKKTEPIWHVAVAIVVAICLQLVLNESLTLVSKYAIAGLEFTLLIIIVLWHKTATLKRLLAFLLLALISVANIASLAIVIAALFAGTHLAGRDLLISATAIYLTNIIVFGLWYWELDATKKEVPDFLFPQKNNGNSSWEPTFFDYLYVSITNATAFSPTDTLPLTHRTKLLMTIQGVVSLATIALVAARAVNILV